MLWLKLIHVSKRNPVRRHALCNPGRRIFGGISVSKCICNKCSSWYRFLVTFTLAEGGHMHGPFHLFSHQSRTISPLRWRHNDHDGVSNHQPHGCLLNRLFRRRSKKTSKRSITGLCVGNSPGWVNNREAGDFRRHRAQYDVILMNYFWHLTKTWY